MKKTILIVAALLMVLSGVAAVSAYEAHVVDVRAHVENAMWVEKTEIDFGVSFPQEPKESDTWIGLSESFQGQETYSTVRYELWWEDKSIYDPDPNNPALDPDGDGLYEPIYPYITVEVDGQTLPAISANRSAGVAAVPIGVGSLSMPADAYDNIHLVFDPPVFDLWYNEVTDPRTPSGILILDPNLDYEIIDETFSDVPNSDNITVGVPHTDLGNILKIQVYDIVVDVQ